jgi:hypothetical protein
MVNFVDLYNSMMLDEKSPTNFSAKGHINKQMNQDTYKLRRQVMDYIYRAKNIFKSEGVEMPRINIRITDLEDPKSLVLGTARMGGDNIIWIPSKTLERNLDLQEIVYHEIVHTVFGEGHIEDCPLMKSTTSGEKKTPEYWDALLRKYVTKYKKEKS